MSTVPKACIIGAGSSGIAAAKVFHEARIPFDCFEKSDRVGGNWVFGNKNGMSSAYRSLYINTSRERMQYSDFPMPKDYPDFPHHSQIAAYFERYVDHFGFRNAITFNTGVERAERRGDGVWIVDLDTGERREYDALLVANGHHWNPRWPEPRFDGQFSGLEMHAHDFKESDIFKDRNVVVVGIGNSAMDIAVEASYVARRTILSARRGAHILPKYLFGKPVDQLTSAPWMPWAVRRAFFNVFLAIVSGKPENYGLPKPDHKLGEAHPTISGRILDRIVHGAIVPKPNIARLEGDTVRFVDGTVEPADVIVYCTGYTVTFPFFDPSFISAPDNDLPLFRRVFKPDVPNVFFIGLAQPLGAIMPMAEAQSKVVAEYVKGTYALPSDDQICADIEAERRRMQKRYVASARHTMQVDFDVYMRDLERELKKGRSRARRPGYQPPIPARAAASRPQELPV